YLHAPALFGSAEALAMLLRERTIAAALETAKRADIAVLRIGTPSMRRPAGARLPPRGLSPAERAAFDAARPVGDVCGRYYDLDGRDVGGAVGERVPAVTPGHLRGNPTVAGGAAGGGEAA